MGQPVNYLLGNAQTLLGADPEAYRQQLVQAEQARIQALPPQQALAAQLGNLFGRGLGNVATGQNFFEVTNPVLQKLTKIQGVYNQAMQSSDPNDPLSFYKNLQEGFANVPELGQQAFMAAQERRRVEGELLKTDTLRMNYFKENPDLINPEIDKLRTEGTPESLKRADALAELKTRISRDQEFKMQSSLLDLAVKESTRELNSAKIAEIREGIKNGTYKLISTPAVPGVTNQSTISVFKNGKLESEYTVGGTLAASPTSPDVPAKPAGEAPKAASFDKRKTSSTTSPTTPASASPVQTTPGMAGGIDPFNKDTGTYKLSFNPVITNLLNARNAPNQTPQAIEALDATLQQQIQAIQRQYPGVTFIN